MAVRQNTHAVAASSARRFDQSPKPRPPPGFGNLSQIAQFDQIPKPKVAQRFRKEKGV